MKHLIFVGLMAVLEILDALHCDKEFNYYDNYGNGFDISCQGITKEYEHLLENITITNEISLKIDDSILTKITSKLFRNVCNIRYFFLVNSTFTFATADSVFASLSKLEHLVVNNTNFYVNQFTFVGPSTLKELILNNNGLGEIEKGAFKNLPILKHLQITNNKVKDLNKLPLCELTKLRSLNLSKNIITSIKDAHFNCRHLKDSVDFHVNDGKYLLYTTQPDFFTFPEVPFDLHSIDLSYNKISELESSLTNFKNLKVLNFEGNKLIDIKNRELAPLHNLEKVYLRNNLLITLENVFHNKEKLQHLDVSRNRLAYFSLNNVPMLGFLELSYNKLNISSINNINNVSDLSSLILNNNEFSDIKPNAFGKFDKLTLLDLGSNFVILHNHSLDGLRYLKNLILSNNSIEQLPQKLFIDMANLRQLDLSQNKIKYFLNNTFKGLGNLEVLNVSFNLLEQLPYALLQPLNNVQVLDLGGNQIHYVEYDLIISDLPSLSVLNIKSNLLSCQLLSKIIKYLKQKGVGYTINKMFDYEKENVAGIYCNSENSIIVPKSLRNENFPEKTSALFVVGVIVVLVVLLLGVSVALFRIHIWLKRRKYRADEFELIDE